jgi:hypothetical protein
VVAHPRATLGPRYLRSLNEPRPIRVEADAHGQPRRVWATSGHAREVSAVQDRWRIDDEWWRERPVARLYHALLLEDGSQLVVYRDLLADGDHDGWFAQHA